MGSDSKPQSLGAESDTAHQVWGSHSPLKPLYKVTLVLDINECDTPDQRLLVSVTVKYQYS